MLTPNIDATQARARAALVAAVLLLGIGAIAAPDSPASSGGDRSQPNVTSVEPLAGAAVSTRGWRTLRGRRGFRIRAPRGYRLRIRRGAYEVIGKRAELSLLALRTGDSPRNVAEALLRRTLPKSSSKTRLGVRLKLKGGRRAELYFSRVRKGVSVLSLSPRGKGRKSVASSERRRLATVARTARRVGLVRLARTKSKLQEPAIPLKPFTNADGSAKANVPDAAGWTASGQAGAVEGSNPDLGGYAFGINVPFLVPEAFCFTPCSLLRAPFLPAGAAVEQALPLFLASAGARVSDMRVARQVPGSAGVLGPGIDSGMFEITFTSNGRASRGYITAGTFGVGDGIWYLYYSYIATFVGVSGSVGDALLRTWQSWDPSVDQARRQAQTFVTLRETTEIIQQASEYRRRVFEKSNFNFTQLIRGKDPVLDPVAQNVVGEGGETLVRRSDGKLFDLEGNQFALPSG